MGECAKKPKKVILKHVLTIRGEVNETFGEREESVEAINSF